jgi:general secretion pathway protein F/type IV pilus assembly protein PilC
MPAYAYIARDAKGQKQTGSLDAPSEREAISMLTSKSLFPVEVKTDTAALQAASSKHVSAQVMTGIYSQLASLLRSGVPLLKSIAILRDQSSNPTLKVVLGEVHSRVEEGTSLADAMVRYPRVFSEITVNLVRAGAEGGFLEDALERVAFFTEQQDELRSRTIGAVAYPLILLMIGSVVVVVLVVFFVPMYAQIFERLKERGELPMLTAILLWFSDTLGSYGFIFLLLGIAGFVLGRARLQTPAGRRWLDTWRLKLPMAGTIFRHLAVARFCRVLGTLLKNDVPILKSLEISREATGNVVLSQAIAEAAANITSGQSLARPLAASKQFPLTVVEMIAVAEESNTLDRVLVDLADNLEKRTMRQLDLGVRLLEPLLLLLLAGVVLCVVVALLLPIINMSKTI